MLIPRVLFTPLLRIPGVLHPHNVVARAVSRIELLFLKIAASSLMLRAARASQWLQPPCLSSRRRAFACRASSLELRPSGSFRLSSIPPKLHRCTRRRVCCVCLSTRCARCVLCQRLSKASSFFPSVSLLPQVRESLSQVCAVSPSVVCACVRIVFVLQPSVFRFCRPYQLLSPVLCHAKKSPEI